MMRKFLVFPMRLIYTGIAGSNFDEKENSQRWLERDPYKVNGLRGSITIKTRRVLLFKGGGGSYIEFI